ncbi:MAG: hypothetical protein ABUT20_02335 [Bacteroidota bacterium]
MQKFELTLKNEKQKLYRRLTVFILLFNAAAISWFLFSLNQLTLTKIIGVAAIALLVIVLYRFIFFKKGNAEDLLFSTMALITFIYWVISGHFWVGVVVASLFFLYFINKRKLVVSFYSDKIEYPSFPKRIINWTELSNVILKDELLTIDFKNNKIIQQFIEESNTAGNEKEFNDFCRQLLNK